MSGAHGYERRAQADGSTVLIQVRADGSERPVSDQHQGYLAWVAAGNTAPVLEYAPPPAPSAEETAAARLAEIRSRLQETDCLMVIDSPITGADFDTVAEYRDLLRQRLFDTAALPDRAPIVAIVEEYGR